MQALARAAAALVGLFGVLFGLRFLTDTRGAAASLALQIPDNASLATVRADMSAFFLVSGLWGLYAAWKGRGDALLVPAALYGIAILGRAVNMAVAGPYEGATSPMIGEVVLVALCLFGYRTLRARP